MTAPMELTEAEMDVIIKAFLPFDHSCAHNVRPVFGVVETIVAAREAAARREALLEAGERIDSLAADYSSGGHTLDWRGARHCVETLIEEDK